jgi:hypothetical protein
MPSKNPLADGLLEVADVLLKQRGRPIFVQAALRRSISTGYYAVFHTLCQVCGDGFRLWTLGGDERRLAVFLLFDPKNPVREKGP